MALATSSLLLVLAALWAGPPWGQHRSEGGSIDPGRVSALVSGMSREGPRGRSPRVREGCVPGSLRVSGGLWAVLTYR